GVRQGQRAYCVAALSPSPRPSVSPPSLHPSRIAFGVELEPFGAQHEAPFGDDAVADRKAFEHGVSLPNLSAESHASHTVSVRVWGREEDDRLPAHVLHGARRDGGSR